MPRIFFCSAVVYKQAGLLVKIVDKIGAVLSYFEQLRLLLVEVDFFYLDDMSVALLVSLEPAVVNIGSKEEPHL